jgi:hypothetical protein
MDQKKSETLRNNKNLTSTTDLKLAKITADKTQTTNITNHEHKLHILTGSTKQKT